jgi:hypothetical protein
MNLIQRLKEYVAIWYCGWKMERQRKQLERNQLRSLRNYLHGYNYRSTFYQTNQWGERVRNKHKW